MNFAIIVAAGKSKRMGKNVDKVLLPILNKPMIYHTLKIFQDCDLIDEIIVVVQKDDIEKINKIRNQNNFNKIKKIIAGGKERQDSVYNGLISIENAGNENIVVVHNGSNPLVRDGEIVNCINAAKRYGAAAAGFPLKDTIKKTKEDFVEKTIDRGNIYQVQTPQAIKYGLFVDAFSNAKNKKLQFTDDVSLVEALDKKVKIVPCSYENIKITTDDDLKIAEAVLMRRNSINTSFRVGFGQDSHKFSSDKNKKLVLGGCTVPNEIGLESNSNGDVILHALFNAISSAIGEKSLGFYADPMFKKGVTDSKEYLKVILNKLSKKNLKINNASIMIEAKKPRLDAHTDSIKNSLSKILSIEKEKIGVACTSGDELTSFGQGKGMQCFVAVSLHCPQN
ncbi:2-C-methyl-D-erythritol 4-phosphate cytidylyltransferase [Candidatus Woesearchaeota archaeon]|nr:2-C-methyl-D-erythritol 4-phosphate cytidylyltransferase [Candidatus Woesearchaeota archaeon]